MAAWGQESAFGGGDGTESNPYLISSKEHLTALATAVNSGTDYSGQYFKLSVEDKLDLGCSADSPWIPIGIVSAGTLNENYFKGTFDGNKKTISGLYIKENTTEANYISYQGLFGLLGEGGTIKDLHVEGTVTVSGDYTVVGTVCGSNSGKITGCSSNAKITIASGGMISAGGIVGYNDGEVRQSYNAGNITVDGSGTNVYLYIGGVAGENEDLLQACYNAGDITVDGSLDNSSIFLGGVCASIYTGITYDPQLLYCYNAGLLSSSVKSCMGGVAGVVAGNNTATVTGCFHVGGLSSTGSDSKCGSICGNMSSNAKITYSDNGYLSTSDYKGCGYVEEDPEGMSRMTPQELVEAVNTQFATENSGWPKDAKASYDSATGDITMPTLVFNDEEEDLYTITISEDIQHGTVEASPTSAKEGTTITLTVTPNEGYELSELKYDETVINEGENGYQFTMPASNVTVTATFKAKTYTITINTPPTGGTIEAKAGEQMITSGGKIAVDTEITLTATSEEGYKFDRWTVMNANNEAMTVTGNTFTMPASDVTVTATFTEIGPGPDPTYYMITVESTTNGKVTASPETAKEGDVVTLTVKPDSGYELWGLSVTDANGSSVGVYGYTFTMPASDVTVKATFTEEETEPDPGPEPEPEPEPEPVPEPEPEPEPAYFTLDFDDHPCEGVTLNSNLTAVEEGGTLYLYVEKEDETLYDYDNMRIYAKRGANADWEELTEDPKRPGVYPIERIWTDIFIKVEGVEPIEPPTAIAGVQGVQVYAREGAILVHTPTEARVVVVAMNGTVKASGKQTGLRRYALPRGFYVVWVDGESFKVAN